MNEFLDEIFEDEDYSKIERYEISSYTVDKPVETLIKWKSNGKLVVPDFQRDYVWKYAVACKFIDSILLNLPVPGIFVCKIINKNIEEYHLIDGLQRITTLEQFKKGFYESAENKENKKFKLNLKNSEWNGKAFDDLNENEQEYFLDYSLSLTVFEITEKNESKNKNAMFEIFERINTGSDKLTSQEIRNAIYPGDFLKLIKFNSENPSYINLIELDNNSRKRKKDQEILLRFSTYYHIYKQYEQQIETLYDGGQHITSSKIESLNNYLLDCNANKIDGKTELEKVIQAIEYLNSFSSTCFYGLHRELPQIGNTIHEVFSEALVIAVIENNYRINLSPKEFDIWKIQYFRSDDFNKLFVTSTTSKNNVINRVELMKRVISNGSCGN